MPIYLVHGFRWARKDIRIFVIINNIEDAAPDYLMSGLTPDAMMSTLRAKHPEQVNALPDLTFVEQYDPEDIGPKAGCQPYAFVADRVVEADLSIDVAEAMNKSISVKEWDAMVDLRDELAKDEKVGWYVVYNGDVARDGRMSYESSKESDEKKGKNGIMKWLGASKA